MLVDLLTINSKKQLDLFLFNLKLKNQDLHLINFEQAFFERPPNKEFTASFLKLASFILKDKYGEEAEQVFDQDYILNQMPKHTFRSLKLLELLSMKNALTPKSEERTYIELLSKDEKVSEYCSKIIDNLSSFKQLPKFMPSSDTFLDSSRIFLRLKRPASIETYTNLFSALSKAPPKNIYLEPSFFTHFLKLSNNEEYTFKILRAILSFSYNDQLMLSGNQDEHLLYLAKYLHSNNLNISSLALSIILEFKDKYHSKNRKVMQLLSDPFNFDKGIISQFTSFLSQSFNQNKQGKLKQKV